MRAGGRARVRAGAAAPLRRRRVLRPLRGARARGVPRGADGRPGDARPLRARASRFVGALFAAGPGTFRPVRTGLLVSRGAFGGLAALLYFFAIELIPAGEATLLNNTFPIWAVLLSLFAPERAADGPPPRRRSRSRAWACSSSSAAAAGRSGSAGASRLGIVSAILGGAAVTSIRALRATDNAPTIFFAFAVGGLLVSRPYAFAPWGFTPAPGFACGRGRSRCFAFAQLLMTEAYGALTVAEAAVWQQLTPIASYLWALTLGERIGVGTRRRRAPRRRRRRLRLGARAPAARGALARGRRSRRASRRRSRDGGGAVQAAPASSSSAPRPPSASWPCWRGCSRARRAGLHGRAAHGRPLRRRRGGVARRLPRSARGCTAPEPPAALDPRALRRDRGGPLLPRARAHPGRRGGHALQPLPGHRDVALDPRVRRAPHGPPRARAHRRHGGRGARARDGARSALGLGAGEALAVGAARASRRSRRVVIRAMRATDNAATIFFYFCLGGLPVALPFALGPWPAGRRALVGARRRDGARRLRGAGAHDRGVRRALDRRGGGLAAAHAASRSSSSPRSSWASGSPRRAARSASSSASRASPTGPCSATARARPCVPRPARSAAAVAGRPPARPPGAGPRGPPAALQSRGPPLTESQT